MNLTKFKKSLKKINCNYDVISDFESEKIKKINNDKYYDEKNGDTIDFETALYRVWSTNKIEEIVEQYDKS